MSRGGLGLAKKGRKTRELTDRAPRVRPIQDRAKHTVQPTQKPTTRTSNTTSLPADKQLKRDLGALGRPNRRPSHGTFPEVSDAPPGPFPKRRAGALTDLSREVGGLFFFERVRRQSGTVTHPSSSRWALDS